MIHFEKQVFPGKGKALIVFLSEGEVRSGNIYLKKLDNILKGKLAKITATHLFTGEENQHVTVEGGSLYEHIILYGIGKEKKMNPSGFREHLAGAIRLAVSLRTPSLGFFCPSGLKTNGFETGKMIALAFHLAQYRFDKYRGKEELKKRHKISELFVYSDDGFGAEFQQGAEIGEKIAGGIILTRDLVNEPASAVHPASLAKEARKIASESQGLITVEVLNENQCREKGMGAFLAVAQGSEHEPQFIILTYRPKAAEINHKKICFIGKSITFDSGGLSLKPSKAMEDMKIDMAGGASVLGVFRALAQGLHTRCEVVGILPACENMPSGKALRPGDIVTAMNGKTIEVLNTDAEGRLALADAVCYAEKIIKPDLIIDFATLTGACMVALGEEIAGVFGNNDTEIKRFMQSAQKEGEDAWVMPYHRPYRDLIKSEIADLKNVSGKGYGGAITAALFIGEFVSKTNWIHVDIAGPAHNSGRIRGTVGKGGTGWGVSTIINLLQNCA